MTKIECKSCGSTNPRDFLAVHAAVVEVNKVMPVKEERYAFRTGDYVNDDGIDDVLMFLYCKLCKEFVCNVPTDEVLY